MTSTDVDTLEGTHGFVPEGLVVAPDALGETYWTRIAGHPVQILLPRLNPDASSGWPEFLLAPEFHHLSPSGSGWGEVTWRSETGPKCAVIEKVGLRFECDPDPSRREEVCGEIDAAESDWWDLVASWLDTFTELNLLRHGRRETWIGSRMAVRTSDGSPVSWAGSSTLSMPKQIVIPSRVELQRSFALAGTGTELPDAWSYLREANSWLSAGQLRRAAIDASTAAEIALSGHARKLAHTRRNIAAELKKCTGLSDLAELVRRRDKAVTWPEKNETNRDLARVRNKAAHAGVTPSPEKGKRAVAIASAFVGLALPLAELEAKGDQALAVVTP